MQFTGFGTSSDAFQTLYLSYLGQPADAVTLSLLSGFADGTDPAVFDQAADTFATSDSFATSYAGQSPENYVRWVYFNLFDRNAEIDEVETWVARLESGTIDDGDLPRAILEAAPEVDVEAYDSKLFIANYVTEAQAEDGYVPDMLTRQSFRGNEELWYDLQQLDAEYDTLSLEQVGSSVLDKPIYAATVGEGDIDVMFVTQQHGDEPIGTAAAMYLLDYLAGDDPDAAAIRENVTVTMIPRLNPDGFERWEQEVGGVRGLVDPRRNENDYDLNRTYDPADPIDPSETPESQTLLDVVAEVDPKVLFDWHDQGNYRTDDGDLVTMSVLWPLNDAVDPEVVETAKKAVVSIDMAVDELDFTELTLYPGSDNPAIGRNGISMRDTPTVLVEQRFLQEMFYLSQGLDTDYSALTSALALEGFIAMKGVVEDVADGSFDDLDPALAETIPPRPDGIEFAQLYSDDAFV